LAAAPAVAEHDNAGVEQVPSRCSPVPGGDRLGVKDVLSSSVLARSGPACPRSRERWGGRGSAGGVVAWGRGGARRRGSNGSARGLAWRRGRARRRGTADAARRGWARLWRRGRRVEQRRSRASAATQQGRGDSRGEEEWRRHLGTPGAYRGRGGRWRQGSVQSIAMRVRHGKDGAGHRARARLCGDVRALAGVWPRGSRAWPRWSAGCVHDATPRGYVPWHEEHGRRTLMVVQRGRAWGAEGLAGLTVGLGAVR